MKLKNQWNYTYFKNKKKTMKNTKEVQELKLQVLDLTNQVKVLQKIDKNINVMQDYNNIQIKILYELAKLVEFKNAKK